MKPPQDSAEMSYLARPVDANTRGTVFGGRILELMDMVAAICARRFSQLRVATLSVEEVKFLQPLKVGHVLNFFARINRTFRTSLEVGIEVWGEDTYKKQVFHAASAYFIIVTLDEQGNPTRTPEFIPRTEEEKMRWEQAEKRREARLKSH